MFGYQNRVIRYHLALSSDFVKQALSACIYTCLECKPKKMIHFLLQKCKNFFWVRMAMPRLGQEFC